MTTQPVEAHHLKKGSYALMKGWPCKVIEVKTSKTGKHGHAKCNITGIDVFTGRKYNDVAPGHVIFNGFEFAKTEYDVLSLDDGIAQLMDAENQQRDLNVDIDMEPIRALMKDMEEGGDEKYWTVTVGKAPVGEGDKCKDCEAIITHAEQKE